MKQDKLMALWITLLVLSGLQAFWTNIVEVRYIAKSMALIFALMLLKNIQRRSAGVGV